MPESEQKYAEIYDIAIEGKITNRSGNLVCVEDEKKIDKGLEPVKVFYLYSNLQKYILFIADRIRCFYKNCNC